MVGFIRSLFESALKTNDALERAVITGCLRISKESIFTGLNHLRVNSIRGERFGEYFGFTQEETTKMLFDYGLSDKVSEVKEWYDGYLFGDSDVYNPWSVINYVDDHSANKNRFPEPYWSNTSSNTIIRELVENSTPEQKRELDILISGGTIEKQIHEDITYADVHENEDNLWNFLYFTGYMRKVSERQDEENVFLTMRIPNLEVKAVYSSQIRNWFEKRKKEISREPLYRAIENRDGKAIFLQRYFRRRSAPLIPAKTFIMDYFCHFYTGCLITLRDRTGRRATAGQILSSIQTDGRIPPLSLNSR